MLGHVFLDITTKVFQQTGWKGIICGTKQEHIIGEQILKQSDAPLQNLCGQTTLMELAGLLSHSRLTISNDTGVVFLSSAVETQSVCIVGGGHFGRFVPYPDLAGKTNQLWKESLNTQFSALSERSQNCDFDYDYDYNDDYNYDDADDYDCDYAYDCDYLQLLI